MKHKKGLIVFTVLFTIVVFFSIFFMTWFWGDEYEDFEGSTFREEVDIPGLKDGACPQGLAMASHRLYNKDGEVEYVLDSNGEPTALEKTQDYYFISAYFNDKPSRIYVTGKDSGYLGYVSLTYNGKPFKGHVGGVATNGTWLWLASENKVYCVKRSDTKAYTNVVDEIIQKCVSNNEFELNPDPATKSYFQINGSASFISYFKPVSGTATLYVGEFYRAGNYETPSSHHLTTPDGKTQRAFMYEYNVNSSGNFGLTLEDDEKMSEPVPEVKKIFSIPDRIQGVARVSGSSDRGDTLILSQSYGLDNSEIMLYDYKTIETGKRDLYTTLDPLGFEYAGVTIKSSNGEKPYRYTGSLYVYYVYGDYNSKTEDKNGNKLYPSFYRSYSIPSMSEGLAVSSSGRVNILFESASNKYKLFVRQPIDKIYSFMPYKR